MGDKNLVRWNDPVWICKWNGVRLSRLVWFDNDIMLIDVVQPVGYVD